MIKALLSPRLATTPPLLPSSPSPDGTATTWLRLPPTWPGTRWDHFTKVGHCLIMMNNNKTGQSLDSLWKTLFPDFLKINCFALTHSLLTRCDSLALRAGMLRGRRARPTAWPSSRPSTPSSPPAGPLTSPSGCPSRLVSYHYCYLSLSLMVTSFGSDECMTDNINSAEIFTTSIMWCIHESFKS